MISRALALSFLLAAGLLAQDGVVPQDGKPAATAQQAGPSIVPGGWSILGRAIRAGSNRPLGRAIVELRRLESGQPGGLSWLDPFEESSDEPAHADVRRNQRTSDSGSFDFFSLDAGRYALTVTREGFVLKEPVIVTLLEKAYIEVELPMVPAAAIQGRVLGPLGEPLAAATVEAYRVAYTPFGRRLVPVRSTLSDDLGSYRLFWLDPGSYVLAASYGEAAEKPLIPGNALTPNLSSGDDGFASTYFPGQWNVSDAARIDLGSAADVDGTNIQFGETAPVRIRGRVSPPRSARLTLVGPNGDPVPGVSRQVAANAAGEFEIRGVSPGPYVLLAAASDGAEFSDVLPLEVSDRGLDDVLVRMSPSQSIAGAIFNADPKMFDSMRVVLARVVRTNDAIRFFGVYTSRVDAKGNFAFRRLPAGNFEVFVAGLSVGTYVRDIRSGGVDVLTGGLDLTGPRPPLQIRLDQALGKLRGRVNAGGGLVSDGARIVLVPSRENGLRRPDRFRVGSVGANGEFEIDAVPPGTYEVFAFETLAPDAHFDPELIARFPVSGVPVTVEAGRASVGVEPNLIGTAQTAGWNR